MPTSFWVEAGKLTLEPETENESLMSLDNCEIRTDEPIEHWWLLYPVVVGWQQNGWCFLWISPWLASDQEELKGGLLSGESWGKGPVLLQGEKLIQLKTYAWVRGTNDRLWILGYDGNDGLLFQVFNSKGFTRRDVILSSIITSIIFNQIHNQNIWPVEAQAKTTVKRSQPRGYLLIAKFDKDLIFTYYISFHLMPLSYPGSKHFQYVNTQKGR